MIDGPVSKSSFGFIFKFEALLKNSSALFWHHDSWKMSAFYDALCYT